MRSGVFLRLGSSLFAEKLCSVFRALCFLKRGGAEEMWGVSSVFDDVGRECRPDDGRRGDDHSHRSGGRFFRVDFADLIFWLFGKVAGGRKKPARPRRPGRLCRRRRNPPRHLVRPLPLCRRASARRSSPSSPPPSPLWSRRASGMRCAASPFPLPAACLGVGRFV